MATKLIGYHLLTGKNLVKSLDKAINDQISVIQIFLTNTVSFNKCTKDNVELEKFGKMCSFNGIQIFVHAPYVINLCNNDAFNVRRSTELIHNLLEKSDVMNAKGVIIHVGKALKYDKQTAIDMFISNVKYVIKNTDFKSKLIIETCAGQGTEINENISDFLAMFDAFSNEEKEKLGICIDTCHVFVAGNDLRTKSNIDNFFISLKPYIKLISCFHLNDSKAKFKERKDRHADLGFGYIGLDNLKIIYKKCVKRGIPMILETKQDNLTYIDQINKLSN